MNTILLDLDGTVLPLDMDLFMTIYFAEMEKVFSDLPDHEMVVKNVWAATGAAVKSTEKITNEEAFMNAYGQLIVGDLDEHKRRFEAFYDEGFLKTKKSVIENQWMQKSIILLKEKGYNLVLATNPIFPMKAIHHRIRWAGFEPSDFSYISSFEKNHYCKPQIKYYEEVLSAIGKKPEECMMVGNDVQEDMIVHKLGVKTFLIDEHILHRTDEPIQVDYQGNYEDFYIFVEKLPKLN
ncbi:MAG: HAD family hydrolase [Firmicutes bacterium HGW-Firmicutes-1]|jgi:FMN phosphatase YigB (HAD superfamily)|nr:MAG: HAD family hydrolase [Firmicutes bacterium HGW-Firmicutes-1]